MNIDNFLQTKIKIMAKSQRKNVRITVPADHEEEIRRYLEALSMNDNEDNWESDDEDIEEYEDREISSVFGHRIEREVWQFCVKWKGFRTQDWIDDKDCNCERLINDYLHLQGISTAYCFCRVSTKEQAGQNHVSLDAQEAELVKAAKETNGGRGITRTKVIKISSSAYRRIPRKLLEIGEVAKRGDAILIYRVDRLSRNIIKYLAWLEDLNNRGVIIYAHSEKLRYDSNKLDFIEGILKAQRESQLIGERVQMSVRRRRERGDDVIGSVPYGKKFERRENKSLKVVEDLAATAIIREICQSRRNPQSIANILNRRGDKKRGRKWTPGMVKTIRAKNAPRRRQKSGRR